MKLEESFEVQAPVADVWSALMDLEGIAPCLPGAEITEATDDGIYRGTFQVKLGPTTAAYHGQLALEEADEAARVTVMKASGQDKRGQGGTRATITTRLSEHDGGTRVEVAADFTITGRLARFGRGGMIKDVSDRLLADFASCLSETLSPAQGDPAATSEPVGDAGPAASSRTRAGAAKPVGGLSLLVSVLWQRVLRLVGRPRSG